MQKNPIHITQEFKYNDIIKIIDIMKKNNFDLKTIPVVDSEGKDKALFIYMF